MLEFLTSNELNVDTDTEDEADLVFTDGDDNVLVQFADGHIKTKEFDSRNVPESITSWDFLDLSGKTVGFLGDSITAGSGASSNSKRYSTLFCEYAGCTERNMGIGGTCLCNNTKNGASANRFLNRVTSSNINGLDLLVIFGGTNDFSYDSKAVGNHFEEETITGNTYVGTKKRIPNSDNETFSGALHELILAVRTINQGLPIVYITPLNRRNYNSGDPRPATQECNANGDYITDYVDAIKDICQFYSIPVFETTNHYPYDYSQTGFTTYSTDGIHPNDAGHAVLAKALYRWIVTNLTI